MNTITLTISGVTPLMMHSDQMANPLNEWTRKLKEITSKRIKTDDDYEAMRQVEFFGGIYFSAESGVHIPGRNLRKCIEEGAKLSKKGMAIKRGVFVLESELALIYDGPRTLKGLYASTNPSYVDSRMAGAGASSGKVLRTRPIFAPPWSLKATLMVDVQQINETDLRQCVEAAGNLIGLGDYRPTSGGSYGKFKLESWG